MDVVAKFNINFYLIYLQSTPPTQEYFTPNIDPKADCPNLDPHSINSTLSPKISLSLLASEAMSVG